MGFAVVIAVKVGRERRAVHDLRAGKRWVQGMSSDGQTLAGHQMLRS